MIRFAGVLALSLLAGAAHAAGGGEGAHHEPFDAGRFAFQLINFGALLFILIKFGGGAVNKGLRARHEQLKADLDEASKARAAAEARCKQQEERLANLEKEIARMRAAVAQEAEQEKARNLAAAEEKARRIQEETRFQLDQQVKDAELRFRSEVAATAVKIAEEILRRSVDAGDEQRLAQGFVAELVGGRGAGPEAARPAAAKEVVS